MSIQTQISTKEEWLKIDLFVFGVALTIII